MFFLLPLLSLAITVVNAEDCSAYTDAEVIPKNQKIEWSSCEDENAPGMDCGSVKVPLDYTGETPGVLTLPLVRWTPKIGQASTKSIVMNPGGPGDSGIKMLSMPYESVWSSYINTTGELFNVISFDPRGVGVTIPYYCPTLPEYDASAHNYRDPVALRERYTVLMEQGARCAKDDVRQLGQLMGTAFVARDIDAIFDALDEDGLIRYWGFSYGTVLGSTLAAMFPERIDRMVLEGNINPTEFYHGLYNESVAGTDPSTEHFFDQCALAGPTLCPFASLGDSSASLKSKYMEIADESTREDMFVALDSPTEMGKGYFAMAAQLTATYLLLNQSDTTTPKTRRNKITGEPTGMATNAVNCGDWDDIPGTIEDWTQWLELYQNTSSFGGDLSLGGNGIDILYQCSAWQLNARGKYRGTFTNIRTRTPILFVNSRYDPATPVESARNASAGFVGSRVLEHNSPGHCTSDLSTECVVPAVRQYWLTGELPDVSTACEPDNPPFQGSFDVDTRVRAVRIRKRDEDFQYSKTILDIARNNDHLLEETVVCTSESSSKSEAHSESTPQLQVGLSDFRSACSTLKQGSWFSKLLCSAVG